MPANGIILNLNHKVFVCFQFQEKEVYIQVDSVRSREKIKWNFWRIPHQNENTLFTFNFLEFHQQRRLLSLSQLFHKKMKLFFSTHCSNINRPTIKFEFVEVFLCLLVFTAQHSNSSSSVLRRLVLVIS